MQPTHIKKWFKHFALLAILILCCGYADAQKKDSIAILLNTIAGKIDSSKHQDTRPVMVNLTGNPRYDSIMLKKYMEVNVYHMQHEINAYEFQYFTSVVIFIMVIAIVSLGLLLSYKQFTMNERVLSRSIKIHQQTVAPGAAQEPVFTNSSLEVGKDGIKINTAVIGLMILSISLVFFFLYLNFVYKIDIQK